MSPRILGLFVAVVLVIGPLPASHLNQLEGNDLPKDHLAGVQSPLGA
jgi:hypothetical protein